jgi:hypothetical protein
LSISQPGTWDAGAGADAARIAIGAHCAGRLGIEDFHGKTGALQVACAAYADDAGAYNGDTGHFKNVLF